MESAQHLHLQHLYNTTHAVVPTSSGDVQSPISSAHTLSLHKALDHKGYQIHERATSEFCPYCYTIFVPGVTLQMRCIFGNSTRKSQRAVKSKTEEKWKPRKRLLRYTCLSCHKHSDHEILKPQKAETQAPNEKFKLEVATRVTEASKSNQETRKSDTKIAKERAKKRKKNSLLNMLSERKQQEEEAKKTSSLFSLEEFMKQ